MSNKSLFNFIRDHYQTDEFIPLHAPKFDQQEKTLLNECIDSTFVSSVGKFVGKFEELVANYTGAKYAVAVANGTMGLFLALKTVGVTEGDLVITQSLTFVATANAISMLGAKPAFIDVSKETMAMCPTSLARFLKDETFQQNGQAYHQQTKQKISACVPMHTLGFTAEMDLIVAICQQYGVKVVEDAAESLGSFYKQQHSGTFGDFGVFSFNGNKILTTGGGGMLITNNQALAEKAKHLSTTAKIPHQWLFEHDEIGYNLRMPNINAALGVAQMAKLAGFIKEKQALAKKYLNFSQKVPRGGKNLPPWALFRAKNTQKPNYWLNALVFEGTEARDSFLDSANQENIQARPLWTPMHRLAIYENEIHSELINTEWFAERVVNIPSGVK